MFIKLTCGDEQVRVNVNRIACYSPYSTGSMVKMDYDAYEVVDETPEQIDDKIYKVTGQKIGGGH